MGAALAFALWPVQCSPPKMKLLREKSRDAQDFYKSLELFYSVQGPTP